MNRITIKCPKCGSLIETDSDRDTIFCSRCGCGYKILREGQSDQSKIRLMVLEQEEKKNTPIRIGNKGVLLICLIAFIVWIVIFLILNT